MCRREVCARAITFWGHHVWSGDTVTKLENDIQEILSPKMELTYKDYCRTRNLKPENKEAWQKWVNKKCDVLAMWSHIWNKGDIFVTRDKDFHRKMKKQKLIELGAGEILMPKQAALLLHKKMLKQNGET